MADKITRDDLFEVNEILKAQKDILKGFKDLTKEAKNINKELSKAKGFKEFNANTKKAATNITKLTIAEKEQEKLLKSLAREQAKLNLMHSKEYSQLRKIKEEQRLRNQQLKTATANTNTWSKAMGSFAAKFNTLGNIAANVLSSITRFIKQGLRQTLSIIIGFNSAIKDLQAITGASATQIKILEKSALQLGATTKFTAAQVAKLQKEYAKLGFTTPEILAAQKATLALAAATGTELARAAEVAGITIKAFGLNASQTNRVTDVMARSFSSSALDMEKFAESMKFVAPVARKAGLNIEQTTALLAKLADAGISGSMAGTSLRRILSEIDKTGKPLIQRLTELSKVGLTLADAEDEVGQRAQTALIILSDQVDTLEVLTEKFKNAAGAAQEMADIQLDSVAGDVKILTSAWQGFILGIDNGEGVISSFIRRGVQRLTVSLNKLTPEIETQEVLLRSLFVEMDRDLAILEENNTQNDFRAKLIDDINTKYKDYLPNLISEKDNLEAINKATEDARKNLMGRILIAEMEGEISEAVSSFRLAFNLAFEAKKDAALSWSDFIKKYYNVDAADLPSTFADQAKKTFDNLDNVMLSSSESLDKTISEIREKFESIGESFGINFDDLFGGGEDDNAGGASKFLKDMFNEEPIEEFYWDVTEMAREHTELLKKSAEEITGITDDELKKRIELLDAFYKWEAKQEEEAKQRKEDIISSGFQVTSEIIGRQRDVQLAAVDDAVLGEEEAAKKRKEISKKFALIEMGVAILKIISSAAAARAAATASAAPFLVNPITAVPALAALTATKASIVKNAIASTGVIIAQMGLVSAFEKGTDSSPEGIAHVGEKGSELMIDRKGNVGLSPAKDTLTYLQKGTKIIPADLTKQLLSNTYIANVAASKGNHNEVMQIVSEIKISNNKLRKELRNKPNTSVNINNAGITVMTERGRTMTKRIDKYFKS